jgi:hypothetical protein
MMISGYKAVNVYDHDNDHEHVDVDVDVNVTAVQISCGKGSIWTDEAIERKGTIILGELQSSRPRTMLSKLE